MARTIYLWRWGSPAQERWAPTSPDPSAQIIDSVSEDGPIAENGLPAHMSTSYAPTRSYRQIGNGDAAYSAQPGATNHFYMKIQAGDVGVDGKCELFGGWYWTDAAVTLGDYIEFSVVDKDNVLGLFSTYGLSVVNGDVLELAKYVRKRHVNASEGPTRVSPGGSVTVVAGLYLRATLVCVVGGVARSLYVAYDTAK